VNRLKGEALQVSSDIAKSAYICGFPMVDSYRIQYAFFVDQKNPGYKTPWNQIRNLPRVFTPDDKTVQTPNSDTPYPAVGLDLARNPPEIEFFINDGFLGGMEAIKNKRIRTDDVPI
jgi:hypothetical protein